MTELSGNIADILYRNDDFLIAIMIVDGKQVRIKGNMFGVNKGENLSINGVWETHHKYGRQFVVDTWSRSIPKTEEQILSFLTSSMVKGCGEKQARKLVDYFGKDTLEIIAREKEPCLLGIKGIGKSRSKKIVDSILSTFEIQKVISELLDYGVTAAMALRAYKEYGSNTVSMLKRNPYLLIDLDLIGFLKADEIAKRIGIISNSGYRVEACLKFILKRLCYQSGHTYIAEKILLFEAEKALNHNSKGTEKVTLEELKSSIYNLEDKYIIIEDGCVYPKSFYYHEEYVARKLSRMKGSRDGGAMSFSEKHLDKYQKKQGIILAEKQREAIRKLFKQQLLILTGGPGTGKTTVIRAMIDIYRDIYPEDSISLVAPTGRASRKLSEITRCDASTIHRLIGYRPGEIPEYHVDHKLPCKLLIIDEMSMVDISLANLLLQAVHSDTKILFVGDVDQLPSISPGNVLGDMVQAGLPMVCLTEVFRQAQESQIINNAHRINKGKSMFIDKDKEDFFFIMQENAELVRQTIVESAFRFTELGFSLSDILVLSPMKKGSVGTIELNHHLREALNPSENNKKEWKVGKRFFRIGDKVIQLKNNYEKQVFNGDTGIIQGFTEEKDKSGKFVGIMTVDFHGKDVRYTKQEVKELDLGYCITIHKSQGGEAPIVIMPAITSHYMMLARNLIYTGMTYDKSSYCID
ncbi:SF1B family DNA helicase RecD2 [Oceanobacillus damuensis]|uniref:SF1B family DNA helicase RecD2 n=1 Tax=Oceanobacillus damuensis TaxID=937928 RepID=UPI0008317CC9|nr:ATP-dependent RecD-like DNA helicase [Oceanobacillus damuensis]